MRAHRIAVGLFVTVLTTACGPAMTSMSFLSPPPAPQPVGHPIQFFQEARPVCQYQEVGTVSARKRSGSVSMDEVAESLRIRARQMGGDAIIGVTQGTERRGGTMVGHSVIANNDPVISGTVVRFRDSTCTH